VFENKRYALPLDVPQHALYFNLKIMKDAGLVGSDGRPKVPASGAELVAMAKQLTKDDTFGFVIGSGTDTPGYTFGFHHMLWQNGANIYAPDLKRAGVAEPAAIEAAEFWGSFNTQHKVAPPPASNLVMSLSPASWGCGSPGPGTSPRCARARSISRWRRCRGS
jgi:multiple sugar transport system substrate-binding protein